MTGSSLIADWQAARTHPHTYPGSHPASSFVLLDENVQSIDWPVAAGLTLNPAGLSTARVGGRSLAELCAERGLPGLGDRVAVLAYGGNRNPATLALKLQHYGYRSPGQGLVLPVLTARLRGFDAVGAALSGQGYLYADLYAGPETAGTELAVHVLLLDLDQLRVMHDSEGVRNGFYEVAALAGVTLDGFDDAPVTALGYLAVEPCFVSPELGAPLALTAVQAVGRTLPAFETVPMLAHALSSTGLLPEVAAVVGVSGDAEPELVAFELTRYLNGQWWFRRHTGLPRLRACDALETLINDRLRQHSTTTLRPDRLPGRGEWLTPEAAYSNPGTLLS